jgi:peroxiredoxin
MSRPDGPSYGWGIKAPDFTLVDQAANSWTLTEHLDTARILLFLRGDW